MNGRITVDMPQTPNKFSAIGRAEIATSRKTVTRITLGNIAGENAEIVLIGLPDIDFVLDLSQQKLRSLTALYIRTLTSTGVGLVEADSLNIETAFPWTIPFSQEVDELTQLQALDSIRIVHGDFILMQNAVEGVMPGFLRHRFDAAGPVLRIGGTLALLGVTGYPLVEPRNIDSSMLLSANRLFVGLTYPNRPTPHLVEVLRTNKLDGKDIELELYRQERRISDARYADFRRITGEGYDTRQGWMHAPYSFAIAGTPSSVLRALVSR